MAQKLGHGLLDELVVDGLFGLVFIRSLSGEGGNNHNQAVGHVLKRNLAFRLLVLGILLEPGVDLGNKGRAHRLLRRASIFEPAGIVVVFRGANLVGKADGSVDLPLVFRLVRPVPAPALGLPQLHPGHGRIPGKLRHMVGNAVFIEVLVGFKPVLSLVLQKKAQPCVDDGLAL